MDATLQQSERAIGFEPTTSSLGKLFTSVGSGCKQTSESNHLESNQTRKVGRRRGRPRLRNSYEIRGDAAVIFLVRCNSSTAVETVIDLCDLERVLTRHWCASKNRANLYVKSTERDDKSIGLGPFILGVNDGSLVDHKNNDTLDNRRSNLRAVTYQVNNFNRAGPQANNRSGVRGVYFLPDATVNPWYAQINYRGKKHWLGRFPTKEDAAAAWEAKRAELLAKEGNQCC